MKSDLASMTALLAIAGGAQVAHEYLEGEGRRQTASVNTSGDRDVLNLPFPKDDSDREYFTQKFGFVFMPKQGRELTTRVHVPKGWRVARTEHWLWHDLLDEKGQKRGTVMLHYQDGDANLYPVLKYSSGVWQQEYGEEFPAHPAIYDSNGKLLWLGPAVPMDKEPHREAHRRYWKQYDDLPEKKKSWQARQAWQAKEPKSAYDKASQIAAGRLRRYAPKNDMKLKGWDRYFEKPVTDWGEGIEEPKLLNFRLHTTYYQQSGSYADSGSDTLRAVDIEQAIQLAKKRLAGGGYGYRREAKLTADGESKAVWEFADPKPAPSVRYPDGSMRAFPGTTDCW